MNKIYFLLLGVALLFVFQGYSMESQVESIDETKFDLIDQTLDDLDQLFARTVILEWVQKLRKVERELGLRSNDRKIATDQQKRDLDRVMHSSKSLFDCLFPFLTTESWISKVKYLAMQPGDPLSQQYVGAMELFRILSDDQRLSVRERRMADEIVESLLAS